MYSFSEIQKFWDKISHTPYLHPDALPSMELYMDQVTSFMEEHLKGWRRNPEDKILTRTMINNYTKNKLLPPPVRKKYKPGHLLLLNYIYYLKNILSIRDIGTLLQPLAASFWDRTSELDMQSIYQTILRQESEMFRESGKDVFKMAELSEKAFEGTDPGDEEAAFLKDFVFTCLLAFDISLKKRMIESVIDRMAPAAAQKAAADKKAAAKQKKKRS